MSRHLRDRLRGAMKAHMAFLEHSPEPLLIQIVCRIYHCPTPHEAVISNLNWLEGVLKIDEELARMSGFTWEIV